VVPDSSVAEVQTPSADEAVHIQRVDSQGITRRVTYTAAQRPVSAGEVSDSETVLLTRLPRAADGQPDTAVLQAIPIASADNLAACERVLRSLPGIHEAAVLASQWIPADLPVHLEELLPADWRQSRATASQRSETLPPSSEPRRDLPPAIVHGPELPSGKARTLVDALVEAAQRGRSDDLTFLDFEGHAVRQSLAELLETAQSVLGGLRAAGLEPGSRVVLQLPANGDILAAFWGCVLGGCPPVILPVPPSYADESRGLDQLAHIIATLDRPWLITNEQLQADIAKWAKDRGAAIRGALVIENLRQHAQETTPHAAQPEDVAFFSTSSGSTGQPKCVQLTHRGLLERAAGANRLCDHTADDVILNWLPLDHIGSISDWHLRCVLAGCRMVYVPKEYVISQPLRWLDLIHEHRITHSWAPNFAYSLIRDAVSKQDPASIEDRWDLSCVDGLLTAGEAVSPKVVAEFLSLLRPFGFAETAIRPAFGMAELGSGVTYCLPTNAEPLKFHTVARSSLETGLVRVSPDHSDAITFTDLGRPIPGISIRVVGGQRNILPEETVGQVQIRGAAVMAGYYRNPAANAVLLDDGWFDTGDLGFLSEGRLVLTGRAKDVIIVNGSNY
jgi:acyl-CoA synthetase (AMP-forming)/AMP-acid ligase II